MPARHRSAAAANRARRILRQWDKPEYEEHEAERLRQLNEILDGTWLKKEKENEPPPKPK